MRYFLRYLYPPVFIIFFLLFVSSAHAATYYVSNAGLDSNTGTITAPWKTLVYSASKLVAGDILYIRGGIYQEKVTFSATGTNSQPIKIMAYVGETPIIDGNYVIPTSSYSALMVFSGSYLMVDGLEVRNSLWQGIEVSGTNITLSHIASHDNMEHGIITWGSKDAIVQDSVIYGNAKSFENGVHQFSRTTYATGISAAGASDRTILRRIKTYHNWGEGLSTFNATNTLMEDNIVYDNAKQLYISDTTGTTAQRNIVYCTPDNIYRLSNTVTQHGINLQDENQQPPSANIVIINNLVAGCVTNFKWYPFTSNSSMNNVLIANNTFINATGTTSDAAFTIASPTTIAHANSRIINNIIEQDDGKTIGSFGAPATGVVFSNNLWSKAPPTSMLGMDTIIADPLVTKSGLLAPGSLTSEYFKLSPSSPAIDKGKSLSEVMADYLNTSRPEGSAYDIGALEQNPSVINSPTPTLSPTPSYCLHKAQGDANCSSDSLGKAVTLADFEIWRKEYFGSCTATNSTVAACQTDDDGDGRLMDANFDYPGSGANPGDTQITISDFEIWRKSYFAS